MKNLTFKAAALNDGRPTVNRRSTDGQSQRRYKLTPLSKRWKLLMTLVFLFTFAIGNVWAAETVLFSSFANTTTSNYFKDYTVDGKTVSVATTSNISSSSGDYYCGAMGSTPSNNNANYVELTVSGATIKTVSVLITGNGSNKTCQPALLGWEGAIASNTTADYVLVPASQVISNKGLSNAQWHQFDVHGNDLTKVRIYRAVKGVSVAGATAQTYGNAQTLQFYGIRVELEGLTPVCPSGLTISSKDSKTAFTEGDAIELTAALSAGNGDISYQWYKGGTAEGNKLTGKTTNKLQIASCTTANEGDYYCVASKTSCENVTSSKFAITVEADTKCFNMPAITSQPSDLAHITVTGGTLADVGVGKTLKMQSTGIGFGNGNAARLKVTLTGASIVAGTKITIDYNNANSEGSGIGLYNENYEHQVINETGVTGSGNFSHTFTAEEAANYADVFLIDRNNTGKGIIVGSITVEDCGPAVTKHTITLNYNDGATPDGSLKVVDGNAAVKPADPTRGKYTFLGWFVGDTDNEYVWSTAVTDDITLKAHWQDPWTITFDANGGSAVADVTVKHNTKAEKPTDPTKDDNDFLGWFYGDPAVEFDWDANVTQDYALVAHWQPAVAKYDVEYYDGGTKIGTEPQVWANQHPTAAGIETAKPLYTFVGWYLTSALEGDPVALNTVTPVEGLKLYGKWTKAYATSYDMEAYAVSDGATLETLLSNLDAAGYAYTNVNGIDYGHTHNYIYDGMKYKTNDGDLSFNVNAGKLVVVKTGNLPANALTMYINGVADPTVFVGANEAVETHVNNYFYSETEALYRLDIQASKGTCAIKAVTITDPYEVSFSGDGTSMAPRTFYGEGLTLPTEEPGLGNDKRFDHWCTDVDATIPVVLDAEGKFWPTGSCTLYAAYKTQYELSFVGNEATSGSMESLYYAEGDVVDVPVCTFEKSGFVFDGWTYAPEVTVEDGKFTMPGEALVLTAQWVDNSSVAKIIDTDVKYTSFAEAIAAVADGQTIQLLQNCAFASAWTIAGKTITLDMNGKNLTGPATGDAIDINTDGKLILTDNAATDDPTINGSNEVTYAGGKLTGKWPINVNAGGEFVMNGGWIVAGEAAAWVGYTGKVTINNGVLEAIDNAVVMAPGNNGQGGYTIDINGGILLGRITSAGYASACVYHPNTGVLNISGGTLVSTDGPAVVVRCGESHITGGTIISQGDGGKVGDASAVVPAVGVVYDFKANYPGEDINATITAGNITSVAAIYAGATPTEEERAAVAVSGGTFDVAVPNSVCAPNFVPSPQDPVTGKYSVEPKEGVEIIGVVTTGGTNKTVSGLYKGDAAVNLDGDQKIGSGKYIYVTLASGYTFEETDVLVVDVKAKSDLPNDPALEITTGVGNIDGSVWKSIANADYELNLVTIPLTGIAANQTSIGLKRSDHQNTWVNGLKVYRPMMPGMTAITINGEDAVKGTGNTFTITLPEEGTDLAALTVVPTIIRNAPHATTPEAVISNEGAWKEGDNTYRVMDKDGDYTDYTITITLQGEAPAPDIATQPAGVAYCAGSEPTLTVEATGNELHYAWFKEAGETDEAVGTDAASYTVEAAGTYYVIVTNHVDGKLDKSLTSENAIVTLNTAAAITTQPTNKRDVVVNSEVTLSVVATNATGYQWYICDDAEKHNAAVISGAETANYVFNCTANAYYYCVVGNACGADIESNVVSVKLEPEGCNVLDGTIPSAAPFIYDNSEWTLYAVTSAGKLDGSSRFKAAKDFDGNDVNAIEYGRIGMTFAKDVESLTIYATATSTGRTFNSIQVTSDDITTGTPSYSAVTADLAITTTENTKQYILTADNMLLETGKKYWLQFSGTLTIFKICYSEALAMPKLPTLVNQELCAGAAYETFNATITNAAACEGTVSYKWYSTNDTENPVAETAEFTPSAEGTYYVVVTHSAAGHITRTVQSDNLTVAHFDALTLVSNSGDVFQHMGTEATLSVVATGKNVAYVWYTCSNAAGDDAEAIVPAETESSLTIASVAEGVQYYKVVISHDCDATTLSHVFKVEGWNQLDQVDVTATTTWDMTNVSASAINLKNDFNPSKQNERLLLANIDGVNNNASFNSQALMFEGQHIGRTESDGVKHLAGRYVQFNVTVPGAVFVTFASNGNNARTIAINGKKCSRTTSGTAADKYITYALAVEPGSVEIVGYEGESANQYVRISKIEFKAEYSHNRPGLNPANIGTLCWTNNAILGGATLYELAGKNENNKLVFDEVAENRLEAGKPYIFVPENGNTEIKLYNTDTEDALTQGDLQAVNGMHGTFVNLSSADGDLLGNYVISKNHYIYVDSDNVTLKAYRAYITSLDDVEPVNNEPAPINGAPRRRIVMGAQGEQVATGIDNLEASEKPLKLMIDGQMYILRGEKLFDATGRLVK